MGIGSCVQPVNDIRCNVYCCMESKGDTGSPDIIVDGLGQSNDIESFCRKQIGCLVSTISAQCQQAIQFLLFVSLFHRFDFINVVFFYHLHHFKGGTLCTKNGAACCQNTGKVGWNHFFAEIVN